MSNLNTPDDPDDLMRLARMCDERADAIEYEYEAHDAARQLRLEAKNARLAAQEWGWREADESNCGE